MARPGRPASESYQQVCYSVSQSASYSSEAAAPEEDEDDRAPIFSLSKSSMDVVMATGPPHKRDPAWTRLDLRRSSSTNTHSAEQNSPTLQQLHPHTRQHVNSAHSHHHQLPLAAQHVDVHGAAPALSERWISNMHRWSGCSGSMHSRSSTPDTVVWRGGTSRPSSLTQETPYSPVSKPTTPSPFSSPLLTPTLPPEDPLSSSSSTLTASTHRLEDLLASLPLHSPLPSPFLSNSPNLPPPTSTEDEGFLENNSLSFTFPSPIPSSASLAEGGASSDLQSPGGAQLSEGGGGRRSDRHEPGRGVCHLEVSWLPGKSGPTGRRSPLVSSMSDSLLGDGCRCNTREGITKGTMTSQPDLVDAAVQTISPVGSLWGLRRHNMGSHSILGSPPGSRLNLKSSVGSSSNLVSPSSSMFPVSSRDEEEDEQEDDPMWDDDSVSSHELESRRSCLKMRILPGEDGVGWRGSMKQVQWDEDGMTWDVHGASVDPGVLSTAIRKHLELQNSPQPPRRTSKKKKAPKPPLISSVVKAMAPELHPPAMIITSACTEGAHEGTTEGRVEEEGGGKKEETVCRISRAEAAQVKTEDEEGAVDPKSPSSGSGLSRKKSGLRSLRRPGWCGGSSKADD